jgi:hypothetical protein
MRAKQATIEMLQAMNKPPSADTLDLKFVQVDAPIKLRMMLEPGTTFWRTPDDLNVFVSQQGVNKRWHLSISRPNRLPSWLEVSAVRYRFVPDDVTMGLCMPSKTQYINIHEFCFLLHEVQVLD